MLHTCLTCRCVAAPAPHRTLSSLSQADGLDLLQYLDAQILVTAETSKQPPGFKGVYRELNRIIADADSDPRKFTGFAKHWSPQKACIARSFIRMTEPYDCDKPRWVKGLHFRSQTPPLTHCSISPDSGSTDL